ncbi:MAG TPA: DMT family transporter [Hyphomicrobiaceae bacterium]|nr:DMT family transporter [Hyphomicrobiaceae bacterium]
MSDGPLGRAPSEPRTTAQKAVVAAILAMLLAGVSSSLLHLGVRVVSEKVPTMVIVLLRATFTLMFTLPIVLRSADLPWRTNRPGLQLLRGAIGVLSMSTWYYALGQLPLADSGALSFTTGLFVTLGATIWFREVIGLRRIIALATGFLGVLIILRPGAGVVSLAAFLAVFSSFLWAVSLLMAKELSKYDSTLTISFYQPLLIIPFALVGAVPVWVTPDPWTLLILVGMGAIAAIGNYAYIFALKTADAAIVMPFDYVRLLYAAAWGYLFFSEVPGRTTWIGAILIVGAAVFIAMRERQLAVPKVGAPGRDSSKAGS